MNESAITSPDAPGQTAPRRTLIADDSPVARQSIGTLLGALGGFDLLGTCEDGAQALRLAEALQPDLVLMDLCMPGLSGDRAANELTRRFPTMRVIIMSAHDTTESRRLAEESGAHGFVSKMRLGRDLVPLLQVAFRA